MSVDRTFRWPFEPLFDRAKSRWQPPRSFTESQRLGFSFNALAEMVGVSKRTVERWRSTGLVTESADRAAIALGLHPWAVWDDWFDAVPLSALDQAADRADAAAARTTRQEAA